jgi:hypothetical protein
MATALHLDAVGDLFKLDPALEPNEQEFRVIYASPRLRRWIEQDLPTLVSDWKVEVSPVEQLSALVELFCSGETLTYGWNFRPLRHIRNGVWELKTPDLRLFGWFNKKDHFIGHAADTASKIKAHDLYAGYIGEVVRFRDGLPLDEPKFIPGDNPNDVVSNYALP